MSVHWSPPTAQHVHTRSSLILSLTGAVCALTAILLLVSRNSYATPDAAQTFEQLAEETTIKYLSEISKRRRITTAFPNEQSPFYGVQIGFTNVTTGNVTFLNRDLVRLSVIPAVFGRTYDSRIESNADFGPGWRLPVAETLERQGANLVYRDSSNSEYLLRIYGHEVVSDFPEITGVAGGVFDDTVAQLSHLGYSKTFQKIGSIHRLVRVEDEYENWLKIAYKRGRISQIATSSGREIKVIRGADGRVLMATDDAKRRVKYRYDKEGLLKKVTDLGGGVWRYRYDADKRLIEVIDPRGQSVFAASYINGRAATIDVLHERFAFRYGAGVTYVTNALSQEAAFWSHSSGLTESIQDFSGSVGQIVFNDSLLATELRFNGTAVLEVDYDQRDLPTSIQLLSADETGAMDLEYLGGRLASVRSGGELIASYAYDERGSVVYANDALGFREYSIDSRGTVSSIKTATGYVEFASGEHGTIDQIVVGDSQTLTVETDRRDQIESLAFAQYGNEYVIDYEHNDYGLRSTATYFEGALGIDLDYDAAGNMTHVSFIDEYGRAVEDTYSVGPGNQLTGIVGQTGPDISFIYDDVGRIVELQQDNRVATISYDEAGRMNGAAVDGEDLFTIEYQPMDRDAVLLADQHSTITPVRAPLASSVFGNLSQIAYTRAVGTPYGPIVFDSQLARFVLAENVIVAPDAAEYASLVRRMIPLDGKKISVMPFGFDKPSNSLFVPPEFYSVNCYTCIGVVSAADIEVDGSDLPTDADAGEVVTFEVTADGTCFYHGYTEPPPGSPPPTTLPPIPPPANFEHLFQYGDGYASFRSSPISPNETFHHAYMSGGTYVATDTITCSCTSSLFAISSASHIVNVTPPPPPGVVTLTYSMFIPLNHVLIPVSSITPLPVMYSADDQLTYSQVTDKYRIKQVLSINTVNKTASQAIYSGITHGYLPANEHLFPGSCLRNDCQSCKYPGASPWPNEPFVSLGNCRIGESQCQLPANDMETMQASVTSHSETSMTVQFSGDPDNACEGTVFGVPTAADISWLNTITIDWSRADGPTWELDMDHDGFPSHQVNIGAQQAYLYDPVVAGKSPISLAFPRDVSSSVSGDL